MNPKNPISIVLFNFVINSKISNKTITNELLNCLEKYIIPNIKNNLVSSRWCLLTLSSTATVVIAVNKLTRPSDIKDVEIKNFKKWLLKISNENKEIIKNLLNLEIFNSAKNNIDR